MKKVGILTFCNANNYGAVLQAFALQEYISTFCDVELINLNFNSNIHQNSNAKIHESIILKLIKKMKRRRFKKFRTMYLKISHNKICGDFETNKIASDYDIFIVGSDQVWNTDITNHTKAFFLDFVKDKKKISYAASFGRKQITDLELLWVNEYLNSFSAISLREKYSAIQLQNILHTTVQCVCDPVFLLNNNQWEKKLKLKKFNRKYVLIYYMEISPAIKSILKIIKEKYQLSIYAIRGGNETISGVHHISVAGPVDFLNLIRNAEMIVTNSFHAISFSIIFKKKLLAIGHSKWNLRIQNLLQLFNCESKLIDSEYIIQDNLSDFEIDGNVKYMDFEQYIEKSKIFLTTAID